MTVDVSPKPPIESTHLGDGAYAESIDGYQVCLFTSNGLARINEVYLDERAFLNLCRWAKQNLGWEPRS